jgi:hypothetical protein
VELVRLVLESSTPYHKAQHARDLKEGLTEYLALRGYDEGSGQAKSADPGRDRAGTQQGEGAGMTPIKLTPPEREQRIGNLKKAVRRAWRSFELAALKAGKRLDDLKSRDAYALLKELDCQDDPDTHVELADYKLPSLDTWVRYVRKARNALGEQKSSTRRGRPHGKSIVRQDQIEQPDRDE